MSRFPLKGRSLVLLSCALVCGAVPFLGGAKRPAQAQTDEVPARSKFFRIDPASKRLLGPLPRVAEAMRLDLVSVTVDQPQYWPQEAVHLKVVMPGRPGDAFTATVQKRDANRTELKGLLDDQGLAVLTVLDGTARRLEAGEYRVDVATADGKAKGGATFSVVEGSLSAVSLAYEFTQVTSIEALEKADGAWFMGNPGGAGQRWGNGLSFRNQLRVNNQPYTGEVTCHSRCMLPGCNGTHAGPSRVLQALQGRVEGTLEVGGHSGPFQIEFVTPKGSVRHPFDRSGHVEREMLQASGGVTWQHRVGLSPYEGTKQVPGRQVFVESRRQDEDPFEVETPVAVDGVLSIRILREVRDPMCAVWTPRPGGGFEARSLPVPARLERGGSFPVKVAAPFSLVAIGGFVDGAYREGWVMAFPPAGLKLELGLPASGAPGSQVPVEISARNVDGSPAQVSGILEAFDNRVASPSPSGPLDASLGDSARNLTRQVSQWQYEIDREIREAREAREAAERARRQEDRRQPALQNKQESLPMTAALAGPPVPSPSMAMASSGAPVKAKKMAYGRTAAAPGAEADEAVQGQALDFIREGERKVVFCGIVRTGASGRGQAQVTLPPQTGRLSFRFVALRGLDHAQVQRGLDVSKPASVEASVPSLFVPGTRLQLPLQVTNNTAAALRLSAGGPGVPAGFQVSVPRGSSEQILPWAPETAGSLWFQLEDAQGGVLDRRSFPVASVRTQPVTWSRLAMGGAPIKLEPGERAVAYPGAGALMKGMALDMHTTLESWFGHSEALSARVAVQSVLLAAFQRRLLDDEGLARTLKLRLQSDLRTLEDGFLDPATGLMRPYPGLEPRPLWTSWATGNLHTALRSLRQTTPLADDLKPAVETLERLTRRMDGALKAQGWRPELPGCDAEGQELIPVVIDGKVVDRVLTDDAVSAWLIQSFLPVLGPEEQDLELAFSRACDTHRFLRAYQRVGALQYAAQAAKALWLKGDRAHFDPLFARITRGMILAQEPGMIQGPATLGGVYSSPMAMVRFLDLLLTMEAAPQENAVLSVKRGRQASAAAMGQVIEGGPGTTLLAPRGAVIRIDRSGTVELVPSTGAQAAKARVQVQVELRPRHLGMGEEAVLEVKLDPALDPLEHVALIAVPSCLAIKQTADILADYRGQLIYGQQASGGAKAQLIAVPFRGQRTLRLLLEGAWPGSAPGLVHVRHIENPAQQSCVPIQETSVGAAARPTERPAGRPAAMTGADPQQPATRVP